MVSTWRVEIPFIADRGILEALCQMRAFVLALAAWQIGSVSMIRTGNQILTIPPLVRAATIAAAQGWPLPLH
jgi:hypothetical protein